MKTYKVIFKGKKSKSSDAYRRMTVELKLDDLPDMGVLPLLNKSYDVYEIFEIWEKIY